MKKIKKYIILIICFVVWIGLLVYFNNKENIKSQKNIPQYVLIDQFHYWKYINNKWINIDSINDFETVEKEINWNEYDVYINNQYYNTFDYVLMNYEEFYFDDDIKSHEITQDKLLLNHDSYLKLKNFSTQSFFDEDVEIVSNFMNRYNYSVGDVAVKNKYVIDDDNVIYILSNYREYSRDDIFYLVFYRRNNRNYLLVNNDDANNILYYDLFSVLDTKNKYDNIILSYGCEDSVCYDMYEYNKGKYVKVIGD